MELTTIFYHADEFCKLFEKEFKVRIHFKWERIKGKIL
jgi:hypothetical protein